jgi:hypothetical protein
MAAMCEGDTMVHTFITASGLIVTGRSVAVADLGQAHIGPQFTDLTVLVCELVVHGLTFPEAMAADPVAVTAHAVET